MIHRSAVLSVGVLLSVFLLPAQQIHAQAKYTLKATPKTLAWGYYEAKAAPVLRIKSGDTVEIQTLVPPQPAQEEKQPIIYAKHLEPPLHYPPVARGARLHGTVVMKLTIAADGAVLAIQSSPPDAQTVGYALLRDETEKLVRKWTFGCANYTPNVPYEKTIKFSYRLEGEGVSYDDTRVVMDLPDQVTITVSPPECDHCPPKKLIKSEIA
jgi:TonB-like protein